MRLTPHTNVSLPYITPAPVMGQLETNHNLITCSLLKLFKHMILSLLSVPALPCPFFPAETPVKALGHTFPPLFCLLTNLVLPCVAPCGVPCLPFQRPVSINVFLHFRVCMSYHPRLKETRGTF